MENDDLPVGRVLSRREVLAIFGAAGAAALAACAPAAQPAPTTAPAAPTEAMASPTAPPTDLPAATEVPTAPPTAPPAPTEAPVQTVVPTEAPAAQAGAPAGVPACVVRPEQTEGPYFVDERLDRSDIRSDPSDGSVSPGAPLSLTIRVSQVSAAGCAPLAGATVDIWHCDALGVYSDVRDPRGDTTGAKFLRGYQVTDAAGAARFTTIYPGWYQGRTVHIHFKVRAPSTSGRSLEFTSQLYFDDALSDQVFAAAPYAGRGERGTRNANDGVYRAGGEQLLLSVAPDGQGYAATFDIGVQVA